MAAVRLGHKPESGGFVEEAGDTGRPVSDRFWARIGAANSREVLLGEPARALMRLFPVPTGSEAATAARSTSMRRLPGVKMVFVDSSYADRLVP